MKKILFICFIVGGTIAFSSCSNPECQCTDANGTTSTFNENDCNCDVQKACDDLVALGSNCHVK